MSKANDLTGRTFGLLKVLRRVEDVKPGRPMWLCECRCGKSVVKSSTSLTKQNGVKSCEAVKKSKKLLKFVLDDGTGEDRVILSGIHEYYEPGELVGKTCVAIVNLPPRPMMGIDSCGMLISAVHKEKGEEKLHLMLIDDSVPAGAKLC